MRVSTPRRPGRMMDDARLERLLTRPEGPRPEKPKRVADDLREMARTDDGPSPGEMLRTRPRSTAPKARSTGGVNRHGRPLPAHGTLGRYKHYGCRCDSCKGAMRQETRDRRAA